MARVVDLEILPSGARPPLDHDGVDASTTDDTSGTKRRGTSDGTSNESKRSSGMFSPSSRNRTELITSAADMIERGGGW